MSNGGMPGFDKLPKEVQQSLCAPGGPEFVSGLLQEVAGQLRSFRLATEIVGLWPAEMPSLGTSSADRLDTYDRLLQLASICDHCYGKAYAARSSEPLSAHFGIGHDIPLWIGEAKAAIRQLAAGVSVLADTWGIVGLRPGDNGQRPTRQGESCWGELIKWRKAGQAEDTSWLIPLPPTVAVTLERCLRRLDFLLANAEAEEANLIPQSRADVFIPSPRQRRALELLDGCAMSGKELAKELGIDDEGQLNRDVIKSLKDRGFIANDRKIGGYYRPDAPPHIPRLRRSKLTRN